jgi:hypothetical protein
MMVVLSFQQGYNCVKHYEGSLKEKGVKVGKRGRGSTNTTSTMQLLDRLTPGDNNGDENEVVMEVGGIGERCLLQWLFTRYCFRIRSLLPGAHR